MLEKDQNGCDWVPGPLVPGPGKYPGSGLGPEVGGGKMVGTGYLVLWYLSLASTSAQDWGQRGGGGAIIKIDPSSFTKHRQIYFLLSVLSSLYNSCLAYTEKMPQ